MRLLPSTLSFAQLRRHGSKATELLSLLSTDDAGRIMRDSSLTAAQAWRSLTQESKRRLVLGFAEGRLVVEDEGPLAHGVANRVVKLRGYGDCIPAPCAQAFIEAVMEII
jgi:hypothetical protein